MNIYVCTLKSILFSGVTNEPVNFQVFSNCCSYLGLVMQLVNPSPAAVPISLENALLVFDESNVKCFALVSKPSM